MIPGAYFLRRGTPPVMRCPQTEEKWEKLRGCGGIDFLSLWFEN